MDAGLSHGLSLDKWESQWPETAFHLRFVQECSFLSMVMQAPTCRLPDREGNLCCMREFLSPQLPDLLFHVRQKCSQMQVLVEENGQSGKRKWCNLPYKLHLTQEVYFEECVCEVSVHGVITAVLMMKRGKQSLFPGFLFEKKYFSFFIKLCWVLQFFL
jgi:hypothetical protein